MEVPQGLASRFLQRCTLALTSKKNSPPNQNQQKLLAHLGPDFHRWLHLWLWVWPPYIPKFEIKCENPKHSPVNCGQNSRKKRRSLRKVFDISEHESQPANDSQSAKTQEQSGCCRPLTRSQSSAAPPRSGRLLKAENDWLYQEMSYNTD